MEITQKMRDTIMFLTLTGILYVIAILSTKGSTISWISYIAVLIFGGFTAKFGLSVIKEYKK